MAAGEDEGGDVGEAGGIVLLHFNPTIGDGAVGDDEEGGNVGNGLAV